MPCIFICSQYSAVEVGNELSHPAKTRDRSMAEELQEKERYPRFHEREPSAPSCTMPGIVTVPGLLNIATSEC